LNFKVVVLGIALVFLAMVVVYSSRKIGLKGLRIQARKRISSRTPSRPR
jgi:hypothetical protein